jgi:hypothetical protein
MTGLSSEALRPALGAQAERKTATVANATIRLIFSIPILLYLHDNPDMVGLLTINVNRRHALKTISLAIPFLCIGLALPGCQQKAEKIEMNTKSRPIGYQLTVAGDMVLDSTMNDILPKGNLVRKTRQKARPPLWRLYELLKGPNVARNRSAAVTSLAWPLGKGKRAGRAALAEVLAQADFEAVSIATEGLSKRTPEQITATIISLEARQLPAIGGRPLTPQVIALEDLNVALLAMYIHSGRGNKELPDIASASVEDIESAIDDIERVLKRVDKDVQLVVLSVGWNEAIIFEKRCDFARQLLKRTGVDVLVGHHSGEFEGLELVGKKLIIYNPGPALVPNLSQVHSPSSLIIRIHFNHAGLDWVEIQPIRLRKGWSRIGFGTAQTYGVIDRVIGYSKMFDTPITNEFGRGILEVASPEKHPKTH